MTDSRRADVAIVGAGISGLATAHYLTRRGLDVVVLEKSGRLGGNIGTIDANGFMIELGPNSIQGQEPSLNALIADLGLEPEIENPGPEAKNRYIVRDGLLRPLPTGPRAIIGSNLFSAGAKFRLLREPFIRPAPPEVDETLADFVRRRLGTEFLDYAIDPFVAGIYAGCPEDLSVRSGFPRLYRLEQRYGSIIKGAILGAREKGRRNPESVPLFSFKRGMQTLVDSLAASLPQEPVTSATVTAIRRLGASFQLDIDSPGRSWQLCTRSLTLALPAHAYQGLSFEFEFDAMEAMRKIEYPPVTSVFFGYRQPPGGRPLDGFGFLVPLLESRQILGTVWNSALFSNRAPAGGAALTTFVGGSRQPEVAGLPDERLVEVVRKDLHQLLQFEREPDEVHIQRWPLAIPQYRVGHQLILDEVSTFEQQCGGLFLGGNFRGGISVRDCISAAEKLSERVADHAATATV